MCKSKRTYYLRPDQPGRIEDYQSKQLKGKVISLVKVLWDIQFGDSTWELDMKNLYPCLFSSKLDF